MSPYEILNLCLKVKELCFASCSSCIHSILTSTKHVVDGRRQPRVASGRCLRPSYSCTRKLIFGFTAGSRFIPKEANNHVRKKVQSSLFFTVNLPFQIGHLHGGMEQFASVGTNCVLEIDSFGDFVFPVAVPGMGHLHISFCLELSSD